MPKFGQILRHFGEEKAGSPRRQNRGLSPQSSFSIKMSLNLSFFLFHHTNKNSLSLSLSPSLSLYLILCHSILFFCLSILFFCLSISFSVSISPSIVSVSFSVSLCHSLSLCVILCLSISFFSLSISFYCLYVILSESHYSTHTRAHIQNRKGQNKLATLLHTRSILFSFSVFGSAEWQNGGY